nr:uncharacterized protein LOC127305697 [Lolium perenne]
MPDEMNNRSKTGVVVSTFSAADVVRLTVVVYSRRQAGIQIEPADLVWKCDYQARSSRHNLKTWKSARPTECINSCIIVFSIREYRGELKVVAFLKVFFRSMRVLKSASILMTSPCFTPFLVEEVQFKFSKILNR